MTAKGYRKAKIALSVFLAFFLFLFGVATGLLIASITVENSSRYLPPYEKADLTALAAKEEWTDEDYRTILLQTGLGRPAADALREQGNTADLALFRDDFFYEGELRHEFTVGTVTTLHDIVFEPGTDTVHRAILAPLEEGDVIVSSSCHTFGWRNGHAALVTDAKARDVLESMALGMKSEITRGGAGWFAAASNFIVLRLKNADKAQRAEIANSARKLLLDVDYSLTVGVLSAKNQCTDGNKAQVTNCAHLVWQAFYNFGYDVDSNGGAVVTVRDIARSDLFEVVQVYGFDPEKLW